MARRRRLFAPATKFVDRAKVVARQQAIDFGTKWANRKFGTNIQPSQANAAMNMAGAAGVMLYNKFKGKPGAKSSFSTSKNSIFSGFASEALATDQAISSTYIKGFAPLMTGENISKTSLAHTQSNSIIGSTYGKYTYHTINHHLTSNAFLNAADQLFGNNTPKRFNIQLGYNKVEIQLLNMDRAHSRVALYDVIARRNLPDADNPTGVINASFTSSNYTNTYGSTGVGDLDYLPERDPYFLSYYEIKKKTIIQMPPGRLHVHKVVTSKRYPVSEALFNTGLPYLKGVTSFTLVVGMGSPVREGGVAGGAVTLSTPDVIYTLSTVGEFRSGPQRVYGRYENDTLAGSITLQNVRTEQDPNNILAGDTNNYDNSADLDS